MARSGWGSKLRALAQHGRVPTGGTSPRWLRRDDRDTARRRVSVYIVNPRTMMVGVPCARPAAGGKHCRGLVPKGIL